MSDRRLGRGGTTPWGAVVLAGLVAAGALAWFLPKTLGGDEECAAGVVRLGGECVGVTDGAYSFDGELDEVTERIRAENERVERSGAAAVSIAYVESMTHGEDGTDAEARAGARADDRDPTVVRQALEGAYLAQRAHNRLDADDPRADEGPSPKVRLLLANTGEGGAHYERVVRDLEDRARGEERLVAVTGLGQSVASTVATVGRLHRAGIPMVGATVAADELAREDPGFFRVSQPTSRQAAIAARELHERQREDPGYRVDIVKDIKAGDTYNKALREGFEEAVAARGVRLATPDGYSFESARSSSANALTYIADQVCRARQELDAVYFAGRGRALRQFVQALGQQPGCTLAVVSGSSALGLYFDSPDLRRWGDRGPRIRYTAYAHPESGDAAALADFADRYCADFRPGAPRGACAAGDGPLQSGQAIMGHDAMLALVRAVELATGPDGGDPVDAGAVRQMLLQLGTTKEVRGLSGPIGFDAYGNPKDKPMAYVELQWRSGFRYVHRTRLWP
ncbi:ABC transporter substrate-binding protein [Streptomyces sp. WMMC500]|uniref:ABC transporter substrate-binding protein n=1 Tax=Streptomyces sp. WMMC500 TaxID=3015154 RepID=UPI00248C8118|nr:ABC transporter substrate-binding protein [Streptomyces sp. WMMC500]WBB59192.1 ABC transporter substrate-binding protein [Streptomyces sp. WMMC500]